MQHGRLAVGASILTFCLGHVQMSQPVDAGIRRHGSVSFVIDESNLKGGRSRQKFWLGGAAPQTPQFLAGGTKPPQTPLKRSFVTFDRGGQTGPPRSNDFFSAPLTIRAPLTTPAPLTTRVPKKRRTFCDAIFFKKFVRLSPDQRNFLTKIRTVEISNSS